ncbi:flavonol 4'-sulfotransferase-like [Dorcoceras hygrometricum]|uniref:Flavonol 4'-sulfotransferase-like n=1 Tax=Dorcoceras hygrometricum TaxID=472368 RepID=A0A2Z7DF35_9LAMI|nr:flavonol 4'-sulfotransferase-like [Dorcoceras hygrometricum]
MTRGIPRVRYINKITGTHGNGDRPAKPPLRPAWLPEDPISPGTANLKPSLNGHENSAAKQLKHNFKIEENTYPKAYTNRGTLGQYFTENVERTGSSCFLKSTVPVSKLVSIGRETQEEFSATNIIQNNGGTRRQSTEENHGEQ